MPPAWSIQMSVASSTVFVLNNRIDQCLVSRPFSLFVPGFLFIYFVFFTYINTSSPQYSLHILYIYIYLYISCGIVLDSIYTSDTKKMLRRFVSDAFCVAANNLLYKKREMPIQPGGTTPVQRSLYWSASSTPAYTHFFLAASAHTPYRRDVYKTKKSMTESHHAIPIYNRLLNIMCVGLPIG